MNTAIIGGRHVGHALSERLLAQENDVVFLEEDSSTVERAADAGVDVVDTDLTSIRALSEAGVAQARTVVVATDSDSKNLLIAQLLRVTFETDRLIVLVNDPQNLDTFEPLDVEIVRSTKALATALEDVFTRIKKD